MLPNDIIPLHGICEPASSLTHLVAAVVFAVLSVYLIRRARGNLTRSISLGIFAFTVVLTMFVSGIYHVFPHGSATRAIMLRLDSAAIFLLIAGTCTPIKIILFKGAQRWSFVALIWGLALSALAYKTIYFDQVSRTLSLLMYLGLGWLAVYTAYLLCRRHGLPFIEPMVLGGIAYTIGGVMNLFHTPTLIPGIVGSHEVWHIFVLIALGFHWQFAFHIATGKERLDISSESSVSIAVAESQA